MKESFDVVQRALEEVLKEIGFSKVTAHSMKSEDMTNGSQCVPEVDALTMSVFYFTVNCFCLSEKRLCLFAVGFEGSAEEDWNQ